MTTKSAFTQDEWSRIVRAPMVAGLAISVADPGGPIEAAKESMAAIRSTINPPSREQLLTEVALEVQGMTAAAPQSAQRVQATRDRSPGEQVLEELHAVQEIVAAKATPDEAAAFGGWLIAAAQAAADAAKDGGFMGFHAQQVSERESKPCWMACARP